MKARQTAGQGCKVDWQSSHSMHRSAAQHAKHAAQHAQHARRSAPGRGPSRCVCRRPPWHARRPRARDIPSQPRPPRPGAPPPCETGSSGAWGGCVWMVEGRERRARLAGSRGGRSARPLPRQAPPPRVQPSLPTPTHTRLSLWRDLAAVHVERGPISGDHAVGEADGVVRDVAAPHVEEPGHLVCGPALGATFQPPREAMQ